MINIEQSSKSAFSTPTNRGAVSAEKSENSAYLQDFDKKSEQFIVFDWIQCTIFNDKISHCKDLFLLLFGISPHNVVFENSGLFGYHYTYSYLNIKIMSNDVMDMGYHIYITGTGCRDLERLGIDYKNLFNRLFHYNCKFTRIDISIDDFTNKYFNLNKIRYYIKRDLVRSKFKTTIQFIKEGVNDKQLDGTTVWFGSRSSKIQVCIYDKKQERINNNYVIDNFIKFWVRTEIRFRDLKAHEVATNFVLDDFNLNDYIKGILLNYIQFLVPSFTNKQKSRWLIASWWLDYLDNVSKITLQYRPYEETILKKKSWLSSSVSKSEFAVFVSNIPDLNIDYVTSDFIFDQLQTGYNKLKPKDLQYINDFRLSRGYNPLEEQDISDFLDSLKEVLLVQKDKKSQDLQP